MKLQKYTPETITLEAAMFLKGKSIVQISKVLHIPHSTVSWHLIHPLKYIDHTLWLIIRYRLFNFIKNPERAESETRELLNSGLEEFISFQWEEVDRIKSENKSKSKSKQI